MVRKSKVIAVPKYEEIDKQKTDELVEERFKKLMRETKNKELKGFMRCVARSLNPDDFDLNKDLVKTTRGLILSMTITICELKNELDEAQSKLKAYQDMHKS